MGRPERANFGPTWNKNNKTSKEKTMLIKNNIPEDEFRCPLYSLQRNCLPGCWGPGEPKEGHYGTSTTPFGTTGAQYNAAVLLVWTRVDSMWTL